MNLDGKLLLNVREAADALGLGETVTKRLIATGALASVKIGRARRVPKAALQTFVDRLSEEDST
jgi:excisionase family DNA binding protein